MYNTKTKNKLTISFLIIGTIFIVIGLIRGLSDFDPKYYVLIASLVGLLISAFAISGKLIQDSNSGKKQQQILDTTIATLEYSRKSLESATDNFNLSQKINNNITGGDNFAFLQLIGTFEQTKSFNYGYITEGENPIYDLKAEVMDMNKFDNYTIKNNKISKIDPTKYTTIHNVSMLKNGSIEPLGTLKLSGDTNIYRIMFYARNGNWRQDLKIIKVNNILEMATYVYKYSMQLDKVLYRKVSKNFPESELIQSLETKYPEDK